MGRLAPFWPRMMKRGTACAYLDLSAAELEREIAAGRLPHPVMLGNAEHWSRSELDEYVDRLTGVRAANDWRKGSPLYNG
ncbi:helix-turn-helix transcriptional regulator [Sphingobium olei]|uniref:Helix-turn-helix transcriptional regulator n=1 Tax=Sphingobium olei TaxID=420955 RepID=A0ABW3NXP5_9SPHN